MGTIIHNTSALYMYAVSIPMGRWQAFCLSSPQSSTLYNHSCHDSNTVVVGLVSVSTTATLLVSTPLYTLNHIIFYTQTGPAPYTPRQSSTTLLHSTYVLRPYSACQNTLYGHSCHDRNYCKDTVLWGHSMTGLECVFTTVTPPC